MALASALPSAQRRACAPEPKGSNRIEALPETLETEIASLTRLCWLSAIKPGIPAPAVLDRTRAFENCDRFAFPFSKSGRGVQMELCRLLMFSRSAQRRADNSGTPTGRLLTDGRDMQA